MKRMTLPLMFFLLLMVSACQPQMQSAQHWLDTPITTQPGAPTHGQAIQVVTDGTAPLLGPWGIVVSGAVTAGLLLVKQLADQKRTTKVVDTINAVGAVAQTIQDTTNAVHDKVTEITPKVGK